MEAETSPYRGRGSSVSTVSTSLGLSSLCPFVTEEEGVGQEPVNSLLSWPSYSLGYSRNQSPGGVSWRNLVSLQEEHASESTVLVRSF